MTMRAALPLPCGLLSATSALAGMHEMLIGDANQQELREIWNRLAYRDFRTSLLSDVPPAPCQSCGMRWGL